MVKTIIYKTRVTNAGRRVITPLYFLDGVRVTPKQFHAGKVPRAPKSLTTAPRRVSGWPKYSEALAVHPDQVPEAQARAKRHGISVEYTTRGDVLVPDRGNWLKLLKLERMHEKS